MHRVLILLVASGCGNAQQHNAKENPTAVTSAPAGGSPGGDARPTRHVAPTRLWSFDPDSYFSKEDFLEGSLFSRDLVVLANTPPPGSAGSVGVVAIDVKTGAVLWRTVEVGWLLHPPHATEPLYFAPYERLGEYSDGYVRFKRLDPRTGAVTATVALDRKPRLDFRLRMVWSKRALLVLEVDGLTAFDWSTGKPVWHAAVPDEPYLFAPVVIGDRIYLPGTTNVVISLVDGKPLAAIPGECCTVVASPDGAHVFVRAAVDAVAEIGPDLTVVRRLAGEIRAASDTHYAIETTAPPAPPTVKIYAYDQRDPVFVLTPRDQHDYYGAIALSGRHLLYYHSADATLSHTDLGTRTSEVIDAIGSHFVVSTEVIGTAGPHLGTPPIIERPYLFTEEWGVHGYLIGDE